MKLRSPIFAVAAATLSTLFGACSLPHDETDGLADTDADFNADVDEFGSTASSSSSSSGGGPLPLPVPLRDGSAGLGPTSACQAGFYQGAVTGTYFPDVDSGSPASVESNVEFTLNQLGIASELCTIRVAGEGTTTESCNSVFLISGGTITGVMAGPGDGAAEDSPYFCTVTGTLDCARQVLEDGWIQCAYCDWAAPGDAGSCAPIVGRFAGPLTAGYDTTTLSFVDGTWNGAEGLAGNDGGMPGPDGGLVSSYLVLDGGYGDGTFGGSGTWGASCLNCP